MQITADVTRDELVEAFRNMTAHEDWRRWSAYIDALLDAASTTG